MKKTAGFAVTTGLLAAMFSTVAYAGQTSEIEIIDLDAPNVYVGQPFAPTKESSTSTPQPWGIEHEEQMRQDIKNHLHFMKDRIPPYYAPDIREDMPAMVALIDGACGTEPTLADYAWAANFVTYLSGSEIQGMNHDLNNFEKRRSGDRDALAAQKTLLAEMKKSHDKVARWIWELNNTFADKFPQAGHFLLTLQEKNILGGTRGSAAFTARVGMDFGGNLLKGTEILDLRSLSTIFSPYSSLRTNTAFNQKVESMFAFEKSKKAPREMTHEEAVVAYEDHRTTDFWEIQNSISVSIACKKPAP